MTSASSVVHELKTWPGPFQEILDGRKRFEIRKNDRGFQVGDFLRLKEYDPDTGKYSGRAYYCCVTYIVQGQYGLPDYLCVMSIS